MESVDALYRAQALYAIVAWRVLQLTDLSRLEPDAPCTVVFDHDAWPVLAAAACPDTPVPATALTPRPLMCHVTISGKVDVPSLLFG